MKITMEELEQVVLLSRMELSEGEKEEQLKKLNQVLTAVEVLNEVDTSQVEPLAHILPLKNVLRADEFRPSLSQEQALQNAPEQESGMFKVPKII